MAVGAAGFHGSPDADGMVEVGYSVDPDFRRRGYARAAMQVLLDRAVAHPDVRVLRATISPDNEPSLNLDRVLRPRAQRRAVGRGGRPRVDLRDPDSWTVSDPR